MFDFLESCELELIQQLCAKYPKLSQEQIEQILEIFRNELDKQSRNSSFME